MPRIYIDVNLREISFGTVGSALKWLIGIRTFHPRLRAGCSIMILPGNDLVRVAELIKLGAQTATAFGEVAANGELSKVAEIAKRIELAADELIEIGNRLANHSSS